MNKQDEEKAIEIVDKTHLYEEGTKYLHTDRVMCETLLEMAAWKERQMIDRAKEFISSWFYEHPHTSWLICSDEFQDLDDCLERLEKEMVEEN